MHPVSRFICAQTPRLSGRYTAAFAVNLRMSELFRVTLTRDMEADMELVCARDDVTFCSGTTSMLPSGSSRFSSTLAPWSGYLHNRCKNSYPFNSLNRIAGSDACLSRHTPVP